MIDIGGTVVKPESLQFSGTNVSLSEEHTERFAAFLTGVLERTQTYSELVKTNDEQKGDVLFVNQGVWSLFEGGNYIVLDGIAVNKVVAERMLELKKELAMLEEVQKLLPETEEKAYIEK